MSRSLLTLALAALLLTGGCDREAPQGAQENAPSLEATGALTGTIDAESAGELMPAIALTNPSGGALNTGALQGEPVLVNLWATWCAPCVAEMPLLDELAAEYDGRLRVVTVSQDLTGAKAVEPFFAARKFTHLEPWLDPETAFGFALGDVALPTTVLYDAAGQEVWRVQGGYDWGSEEARAAIDTAIGG